MNVLVACEFSGIVRDAFRARGHNAVSCDLEPSETPGLHYQGDVRDILNDGWDVMIAFPPCTYLSYMGLRHWNQPGRAEKREEALDFVRTLLDAPITYIALENPKGCISKEIRKEDQKIQPWMFGHPEQKYTCLWLKNLPFLMATSVSLERREFTKSVKHDRARNRSRTFPGIAQAMSEQWLVEERRASA